MQKQYRYVKVAESLMEVTKRGKQNLAMVNLEGSQALIAVVDGIAYACSNRCPHAGGKLNEGFLSAAGEIICPLHRYRFSAKTGLSTDGGGYKLRSFPVIENEGGLFLGISIQ